MTERKFFVCKVTQRGASSPVQYVTFVANSRDVLEWAGIRRVGKEENGTQRILRETKVNQIKKFFEANPQNTIPTSVILAFSPGSATFSSLQGKINNCLEQDVDTLNTIGNIIEWGTLTFYFEEDTPNHERIALIVDGQHRIHGMSAVEPPIPVFIVAVLDASIEEQAFQFVVINNKADKVATDNVKAIISMSTQDEDSLTERLVKAGVNYGKIPATLRAIDQDEDSPFYNLLDWPLNKTDQKQVKLTAIESCLRFIRQKLTANNEDDAVQIFLAIWKIVANTFPTLWKHDPQKFMSKVNLQAVNEFVVSRLENIALSGYIDVFNPEEVGKEASKILGVIPKEFWVPKWTFELQDNGVIRELIVNDLVQITRNRQSRTPTPWFSGLKAIGDEALSEIEAEGTSEESEESDEN